MFSSFFSANPDIEIRFNQSSPVKWVPRFHTTINPAEAGVAAPAPNKKESMPVFQSKRDVAGTVDIILPESTKSFAYEHINAYLIGQVLCPQLDKDFVFVSRRQGLELNSGTLKSSMRYDFRFQNVPLEKESFYGSLVSLRYFVRVVVARKGWTGNLQKEAEIYVRNVTEQLEKNVVKMQVGVDECLHLEFKYESSNINVNGKIKGKINFMLNKLKINSGQIQILRREIVSTGQNSEPELVNTTILGKFQIIDGCPIKGEVIPVRIYMDTIPSLAPSMDVKQFSVKYYLNLVLIDEEGRRYFKSNEIKFWRKTVC